jgi:hypothetical protein
VAAVFVSSAILGDFLNFWIGSKVRLADFYSFFNFYFYFFIFYFCLGFFASSTFGSAARCGAGFFFSDEL